MSNYNYKDYRTVEDVVKVDPSHLVEKMFNSYPSNETPNNTEYVQVLEDVREISRGTTGTHNFVVSSYYSNFEDIQITYTQNTGIVLVKGKEDVRIIPIENQYNVTLAVDLTQEETLKFNSHTDAYVQVKIKMATVIEGTNTLQHNVLTTRPYRIVVYEGLNDNTL